MNCFNPTPRDSWGSRLSPTVVAAIAAAIALIALSSACSDSPSPSVISHSARVDERNGQIVFVSAVLSAPARVAVEYENEYAGKFRTALSETAAEHIIPVVRLRADTVYRYAIGVEKGDGEFAYQARGEFKTGSLPGILATMRSEATGESSLDLILSDYNAKFFNNRLERRIVMMDALGHPVWHYSDDKPPLIDSPMQSVRVQPNGDIMYMIGKCCVRRATPLGEDAGEIVIPPDSDWPHHDFLPLEDGRLLYIGRYIFVFDDSANGGRAETRARVDGVSLYDPANGETERVWDPMDFWDIRDPAQRATWDPDRPYWLHMNSLAKSGDGGYIVSLRNLNQVISVSPDFKTVRWRLGGPGSDFAFPDWSDRFAGQHTATELPNGNVLMFNNYASPPPDDGRAIYSRALELSLDFESETAVKAWEFNADSQMRAPIVSSAYRLDNGNTLINFGISEDEAAIPIAIIEADAQGREMFRLETIDPPTAEVSIQGPYRYRAYPGPKSIMGETMLRAPKRR